jgi:hypothetical protein
LHCVSLYYIAWHRKRKPRVGGISSDKETGMNQIIASLASGALLALAIALLFAGRSIVLVARFVIGWTAAILAFVLALAALAVVALGYMSDHAPAAPIAGALIVGSALTMIGLAARAGRQRAPTPAPSRAAKPKSLMSGAAHDAIEALVALGYGKREAASVIAAASSSLGSGADMSALVKAALRLHVSQ